MQSDKYSLILASKSPRRKELLGHLGIPFDIKTADLDEKSDASDPDSVCKDIARQKGVAVYETLKNKRENDAAFFPLIIASDTIVTLDEKIYGKPTDANDARRMLRELSGKKHKVITAVYISRIDLKTNEYVEHLFSDHTEVEFRNIAEDILEQYILSGDSLDKAGAYGIQNGSLTFIRELSGSYSNVVGFPLAKFVEELRDFLGHKDDMLGKWRELIHC
jgi:septum formation protein